MKLKLIKQLTYLIVFISFTLPAFSQQEGLRLRYIRQNNFTYSANLDLLKGIEMGAYRSKLRIHHNHVLSANRQTDPFVQLLLNTDWWQHVDLGKKKAVSVASWLEGKHFFSHGAYRYSAYAGLSFHPNKSLEITPLVGWAWDYRSAQLDQGFSPALFARLRHQFQDGLFTESRLYARYKSLAPRQQLNVFI